MQAEDEIASIGMVIGASWAGARSMTATSGPGVSLMSEFTGLAYYAETPAVIFDVQRVGPSTGLPTRTAQGDLVSTAFLSHGDTKHIMLIPCSVEECYTMALDAFDLAERFQTPIFVMMDLDLGMNNWLSPGFTYPSKPIDRGKRLTPDELKRVGDWGRYKDVDGDGIPYRTVPGDGMPAYFTRGSGHNAKALYSERPDDYVENMNRLARKFEGARTAAPQPVVDAVADAKIGIIGYGTSHWGIIESRDQLREETDVATSYYRVRAFPVRRKHERVHRRSRAAVRGRTEPRRPVAAADEARSDAGARCEAAQRAPLRRPPARCAHDHRQRAGARGLSGRTEARRASVGRRHDRWGIGSVGPRPGWCEVSVRSRSRERV